MGGTPTTGGDMEKKYIGLKLDEMEKSWNIYTIDEVNFGGCCHKKFTLRVVTNKYDDEKDENHPDNRERNTRIGKSTR